MAASRAERWRAYVEGPAALAPPKPRKKPVQHERTLQGRIIAEARKTMPETFVAAIPNGGKRGKLEAVNLKKSGVVAGVADLVAISTRGVVGFAEVKATTKGKLSKGQRDFRDLCLERLVPWALVTSVEEAMDFLRRLEGMHHNARTAANVTR